MAKLKPCLIWIILLLQLFCVASDKSNPKIKELFQEYFDFLMRDDPQYDTSLGFHNYPEELYDYSMEARVEAGQKYDEFAHRANSFLQLTSMSASDKMHLKLIQSQAKSYNKGITLKMPLLAPVHHFFGIQVSLGSFFGDDGVQKLDSVQDYNSLLIRLKKVPTQLDQIIKLLKQGIEEEITHHNASMFRVKKQFETILSSPVEETDFYKQFHKMPETLGISPDLPELIAIQEEAKRVIREEVIPAFQKLNDFIQDEYYQYLRASPGLSSLTYGHEMYQHNLEFYTTIVGLTPNEVHHIGLNELEELKKKMLELAAKFGYKNTTFKEFTTAMKNNQSQFFSSETEALEHYKKAIRTVNAKLPILFNKEVLQDEIYSVNVEPVPPNINSLAYYKVPSFDGKRKGTFFINFQNIAILKKYETMVLTLHEGNPGHHLQLTYKKFTDMPKFVRISYFGAFSEGWGLYSESLGHELKVFEDDISQLVGFYSMNMLRAARLVVDTGLHTKGWPREKAIQFLVENTALDPELCLNQVDRYISLPGQATAYKIGERKLKEVRSKLEKEEGKGFDVRRFHFLVLNCVGHLETLEECIRQKWSVMEQEKKAKMNSAPDVAVVNANIILALTFAIFMCFFQTEF